jgi:hypothetical protein
LLCSISKLEARYSKLEEKYFKHRVSLSRAS